MHLSYAFPVVHSWQMLPDIELQTTGYHKRAVMRQLLVKPTKKNLVK